MPFQQKILFAAVFAISGAAQANPFFTTFNQGAFARTFLLPALGQTQVVAKDSEHRLTLDQTSEYFAQNTATETIVADGETTRVSYHWRQPLATGWEMSVELPVLVQGGGFLDGFTEGWHDSFGLPNGGRELAPRDRYLYRVTRNGTTAFVRDRSGTALGDARVSAGWQAAEGLALRAAVQLPTGSRSQFTGGSTGLAIWGDYALRFDETSDWQAFVSLGGSVTQESDVLPDLQRTVVGIGGAGLAYRWSEALQLILQTSLHTSLYENTALEALERPGVQTSFGFQYELDPGLSLQMGLQEDLVAASSPDFSVHLAFVMR